MTQQLSNDLLCQIIDNQREQAQLLGETKSAIDGLAGPEGRVTKLEKAATRNFWYTMCIAPALAIAHAAARKFGMQI